MQRRMANLCRPTTVATSAAWVLRHAALIFGLICYSTILPANAAGLSQRMRLPVGQYSIGTGTHAGAGRRESSARVASTLAPVAAGNVSLGYRLPVYWIDVARDPPTSKTRIDYFSGNAEVFRYRKGKLLGKRKLNEAVFGADPWLTFTGIDRPDSALFRRERAVGGVTSGHARRVPTAPCRRIVRSKVSQLSNSKHHAPLF